MKFTLAAIALLGASAVKLNQSGKIQHACDYVDDSGEEIETSLAVQLSSDIKMKDNDEVAETREKFQAMQAQMDAAVAQADQKRAEQ